MAELLGGLLLLKARREMRHGRRREQQVNRGRYTGADYRLDASFPPCLYIYLSIYLSLSLSLSSLSLSLSLFLYLSPCLYFEILQRRDKKTLSIALEAGFRPPLLRYIYIYIDYIYIK